MYIWLDKYQCELLIETEYSREPPRYYKETLYAVQPSKHEYIKYNLAVKYFPFKLNSRPVIALSQSELNK